MGGGGAVVTLAARHMPAQGTLSMRQAMALGAEAAPAATARYGTACMNPVTACAPPRSTMLGPTQRRLRGPAPLTCSASRESPCPIAPRPTSSTPASRPSSVTASSRGIWRSGIWIWLGRRGNEPDLSRIEALPQEWIATGRTLERRLADLVWLIRDRDGHPQLAVLLECQSRYDARMSRRMARYTLLLGQALARQGLYRADGSAVPILPAVFHAGPRPWLAPWERLASPPDLPQATILQPGLTIDIHAHADDDERPPRDLVSCMIGLERRRYQWAHEDGAFARLLRYMDEALRPALQGQAPELERDFVAYVVAGYRSLFPELDFAEPELRSLQALRHKMITLAETYQRERQAGAREERQQTLSEYVRLFWDEATSQAFHQHLSALDAALWPSLRALHAAYQEGRDPLQVLVSRNGLAPRPKDDAAPTTT